MTTIVCLGDSITVGQYLMRPRQAWPYRIERYRIKPAGVNSDTTRLGLERFPSAVQEVEPDGVVIQFGHNDCNRWKTDRDLPRVSAKAYAANLEEMMARSRAFRVTPLLCTLTPSTRSPQHAEDVAFYNEILLDVADYTGAYVIDVRAAFSDTDALLMPDGLHLNPDGHIVYARAVQQALDEVFG